MNEIRVANMALAAYFVISADGNIHEDDRLARPHERCVELGHDTAGVVALDAQYHTVRFEEIVDRSAFLQEFRVAAQVKSEPRMPAHPAPTLAAVPTGTVNLVTTTSSRVMCRPI